MKYVNFAGMAVADLVYIDLSCMINNEKISHDKICMTMETFKNMYEAMGRTIQQYDSVVAEKRKAN